MTKTKSTFLLFALSIFLASCSALCPVKHPAQCLPHFPDHDGWYGGDGAYSILLDDRRTLWLFGDTFVSDDAGRKDRIGMDVVLGNTVALSACSAQNEFSVRYFLKKQNSNFVSFFGENEFLWPQDPFIAKGVLYIPLLIIQGLPDAPAPFNFRIAGHKVARVRDFSADDPRKWPVDYLDWTPALARGIEALATTSVVFDHYVYFYPLYKYRQDTVSIAGNILARIPVDHLDQPAGAFEYLHQSGKWEKDISPESIKIIFDAAVSELSVRFHSPNQEWLAVYLSPADRGKRLLAQTSKHLDGPWSDPKPMMESVPEVDFTSSLYDPHTFCYAGKEHRQFSQNHNLVVTYVCNSSEDLTKPESFLRKNLFLYRPVVKIMSWPPALSH